MAGSAADATGAAVPPIVLVAGAVGVAILGLGLLANKDTGAPGMALHLLDQPFFCVPSHGK